MAEQHHRFLAAGARLAGISVDAVAQNAAMAAKLGLAFPLLSDPDGAGAIKPHGLWDAQRSISRPGIVAVAPDGAVAWRKVGDDVADRPAEDDVLDAVRRLGLPPAAQAAPQPGDPRPGARAVDLASLPTFLRGARSGARALAGRVPEAAAHAETLLELYTRYADAAERRQQG